MTSRLASASTLFCLMAALSCQGSDSGSSTSPNQMLLDSLVDFAELREQPSLSACLVDYEIGYPLNSPPQLCLCEGGREIFPLAETILGAQPTGFPALPAIGSGYDECGNAGSTTLFTGTLQAQKKDEFPTSSSTFVYDFSVFGQCEDLVGETVAEAEGCSGQLTATCGGETVVCDLGPDCQSCF